MPAIIPPGAPQDAALNVLTLMEELFKISPVKQFTKADVLSVIGSIKRDPAIFEPGASSSYELTVTAKTYSSVS